jgi:hypothetical protein
LRSLFANQNFTDVVLICADKKDDVTHKEGVELDYTNVSIPCHKIVLSAFSPYFQAMFSSNLIENQTNRVFMPNVDFKTLHEMINYAYSGRITLNINNVQSLFQLASLFQTKGKPINSTNFK